MTTSTHIDLGAMLKRLNLATVGRVLAEVEEQAAAQG